jgi:FixJ family two-component response regulator
MNDLLEYGADQAMAYQPPTEVILGANAFSERQVGTAPKAALIAIVDDDEWVRKSLARLIKSAGFRTQTFASAEEFVASGNYQESACVILDLRLPGMSGLELQARLAAEHNLMPIVFVSAHDEQGVRAQALQAGAVAFLGKPVNDKALLDVIDLALK